jgi:hypothetical protein
MRRKRLYMRNDTVKYLRSVWVVLLLVIADPHIGIETRIETILLSQSLK